MEYINIYIQKNEEKIIPVIDEMYRTHPASLKVYEMIKNVNELIRVSCQTKKTSLVIFEAYVLYERIITLYIEIKLVWNIKFNNEELNEYYIIPQNVYENIIMREGILSSQVITELVKTFPQLERVKASKSDNNIKKTYNIRNYIAHLSDKSSSELSKELGISVSEKHQLEEHISNINKHGNIFGEVYISSLIKSINHIMLIN